MKLQMRSFVRPLLVSYLLLICKTVLLFKDKLVLESTLTVCVVSMQVEVCVSFVNITVGQLSLKLAFFLSLHTPHCGMRHAVWQM